MPPSERAPRKPVVLLIMDGVGSNPNRLNNAVALANTPNLDAWFERCPHTVLQASGHAVGLPDGQMGNSEVGHLTLGCGSIVHQDLVLVDEAIDSGEFFRNPSLLDAVRHAAGQGRPLHLLGLVSEGGVHSHTRHLRALIQLCRDHDVEPVIHAITDGRDVAPRSAAAQLAPVIEMLGEGPGRIATVIGRYHAMDRDSRWERTEAAWRAIVQGDGERAGDAIEAIEQAYARGQDDEFIPPTVLDTYESVQAGDNLIFFNFRRDRPRQLAAALFQPAFDAFDRGDFQPLRLTTMTEYDQWFGLPSAFVQDQPATTLAQVVSEQGLRQFHCAETEKYAHVTFFLNGGRGEPWPGEDRRIIDSPKVATYDLAPRMSASQVADAVIEAMAGGEYALIVVNFANGDMVGHTAVREAVIEAVETLDREVGRVLDACEQHAWSAVVTADHGNCDQLVDPETGEPHTQHTLNPVPCLILDSEMDSMLPNGGLSDVAPTVLRLMGLSVPEGMSGRSLCVEEDAVAV